MADKLRNNMDAAEYKHVVLGLIFLKYISDAFDELHAKLAAGEGEHEGADPEDRDEYRAPPTPPAPPAASGITSRLDSRVFRHFGLGANRCRAGLRRGGLRLNVAVGRVEEEVARALA